MDSSSEDLGIAHDPSKCSNLSMEEKRELVYQISKKTRDAPDILQSWSKQEILDILWAEMGKEKKYTGLTKLKVIELLLKVVSEKRPDILRELDDVSDLEPQSSLGSGQKASKRQRKSDRPSRLPIPENHFPVNNRSSDLSNTVNCKNSACRANLNRDAAFCKRCSCCICYQYDDNKDPSLWLTCSSEPPFQGNSCGMSCHLECALRHERSGIAEDGQHGRLDGRFYCVACGKVNDLLGCWRKQLVMAKDTRRVDILCYRVSLSRKLIKGTEKYQKLYEIVDETAKKLEVEVGPLTGLPVKMGRGIVNRLSCGPEVQKLCASAGEILDSMLSDIVSSSLPSSVKQEFADSGSISPTMVKFEDVRPTSLTVILGLENRLSENIVNYTLWHRKARDMDYPGEPTCTLFVTDSKFVVSDLTPDTEYEFKVISCNGGRKEMGVYEARCWTGICREEVSNHGVIERSQSPATNCSTLSSPSSVEDESNNVTPYSHDNNYNCNDTANLSSGAGGTQAVATVLMNDDEMSIGNGLDAPVQSGVECVPDVGTSEAGLPITPCKLENCKRKSKSSNNDAENGEDPKPKKRSAKRRGDECAGKGKGVWDGEFEQYVKVIRWLECEGHIKKEFRQKLLSWYSLRATPRELRILKVFVDTFKEDPASLAGQLVDTFLDSISCKRTSIVPSGFCMKLWH